jgi:hypothetical protein
MPPRKGTIEEVLNEAILSAALTSIRTTALTRRDSLSFKELIGTFFLLDKTECNYQFQNFNSVLPVSLAPSYTVQIEVERIVTHPYVR